MEVISQKIAHFDEKNDRISKKIGELPQYCSYFHIQFYGRKFSPELTYSKHGFIIRRKNEAGL